MAAVLVLQCDRVNCEEAEEVELYGYHLHDALSGMIAVEAPGWGWDRIGVNEALHCPAHRLERAANGRRERAT